MLWGNHRFSLNRISCCGRSSYSAGSQGCDSGVAGWEETGGCGACPLHSVRRVLGNGSREVTGARARPILPTARWVSSLAVREMEKERGGKRNSAVPRWQRLSRRTDPDYLWGKNDYFPSRKTLCWWGRQFGHWWRKVFQLGNFYRMLSLYW